MKKKMVVVISLVIILLFILLISVFWFPDIWNKITKGNATAYGNITSNATLNISPQQETPPTGAGASGDRGGSGNDTSEENGEEEQPSTSNNETATMLVPYATENYSCEGCELDSECYPVGYTKSEQYCSSNYEFVNQLESDSSCENNFECISNVCAAGKCIGQGLIQSIIEWFKKFFIKT